MSGLLDVYGALLTAKQLELASAHYKLGQSFSHIAREHKVSRQAIHDAVRHADRILEEYEQKLGFMASGRKASAVPPPGGSDIHTMTPGEMCASSKTSGQAQQLVDILDRLRARVARQGIIYSADWIVKELSEALQLIESRSDDPVVVAQA